MDNLKIANILFLAEKFQQSTEIKIETSELQNSYEIQEQFVKIKSKEENSALVGYKVSLTDLEIQEVFNSDSPVYGTFLNTHIVSDSDSLSLDSLLDPLLEIELIFKLTENLTDDPTNEEILSKALISPGIEIPDSRLKNWYPHISINQLISDNAASGRLVEGNYLKPIKSMEWENIQANLFYNNSLLSSGCSNNVLSNPLNAIKWLHQELLKNGKRLEKGMIVSSGTFIKPVRLMKGSYRAEFSDIGHVTLNVN